jgi:glycosyltransferase involved in cell wall biosynthesis
MPIQGGLPSYRIEVGLDVTSAVTGQAGLSRYAEELWRELELRDDVRVRAFALGRGGGSLNRVVRRLHIPLRALRPAWRYLRWPRAESFVGPVDVVHSLALTPVPTRRPQIATVHDVLPITHPGLYPPGTDRTQRRELASAAEADMIVTTCDATAEEIARVAAFPRERIVVAPPGVAIFGRDDETPSREGQYLLSVGAMTPRKGFDLLAAAAARLGPSCPAVLVAGPDYWNADEMRRAIAAADRYGRVELVGPVDDATLGALYRGATAVCHPSLAEGFGLTCLEAMAAGAPLIATDLPPVREIVDGAAELVPPGDPDALAEALARLLADRERRDELATAGRRRAARFTWRRTADEVVGAYRVALGK